MGTSLAIPLARLRARQTIPGAVLGMVIAHFGIGLSTLGITGVQSFKVEQDVALAVGEAANVGGYDFRLTSLKDVPMTHNASAKPMVVSGRIWP
jgi:cytochrome c biogenesis factor